MAWKPMGQRGGRGQITNRIEYNKAKRLMTTQNAQLTKQNAELKKMKLLLEKKSKEESVIPTFKREPLGKPQKKFNRVVRTTPISNSAKQYTIAMAGKIFVKRPGEKPRNMDEKKFKGLMQDLNKNPLNQNTRKDVKTLEKKFRSL